MNNPDARSPSSSLSSASRSTGFIPWLQEEEHQRLLVLIPANVDFTTVTRRIWKLAMETNSAVELLSLYKDAVDEPAMRRMMVTLSALIQDAKVPVEIKLEHGTNWVRLVKKHYRTGDAIVCLGEHSVGLRRRPLSQFLEADLQVPVHILSGLQFQPAPSNLISRVMAWTGPLAIIAGFFLLQIRIVQLPRDGIQTLLFILLLIPEFWLIRVWNSLFS